MINEIYNDLIWNRMGFKERDKIEKIWFGQDKIR
jgi:hypothetical protein